MKRRRISGFRDQDQREVTVHKEQDLDRLAFAGDSRGFIFGRGQPIEEEDGWWRGTAADDEYRDIREIEIESLEVSVRVKETLKAFRVKLEGRPDIEEIAQAAENILACLRDTDESIPYLVVADLLACGDGLGWHNGGNGGLRLRPDSPIEFTVGDDKPVTLGVKLKSSSS